MKNFYRIEYNQGTVQTKELLSKEEYQLYKDLNVRLSETQTAITLKTKKDKKSKDPVLLAELKSIKDELKRFSKPYFVVGSPLYEAIETGILDLPKGQGGPTPCQVIKLENFDESRIVVEDEDNSY